MSMDSVGEKGMTITQKEESAPNAPAPRSSQRAWIIGGVAAAVLAGAAVVWLLVAGSGTDQPTASAVRYAEVVQTDLEEVTTLEGTLGFSTGDPISSRLIGTLTSSTEAGEIASEGDIIYTVDRQPVVLLRGTEPAWRDIGLGNGSQTVVNRLSGTVTEIADEDTTLVQGDQLYWVNDTPVTLLYGDIPAWRNLRRNTEGPDVQQLEEALVAKGYDPGGDVTIDEEFDRDTENMVEAWQADLGVTEDGRVDLGEVVFLPGPVQLVARLADVGGSIQNGAAVLQVAPLGTEEATDVEQLEAALIRLGFGDGLEVDGVFGPGTETAVRSWQGSIGAEADGVIDLGEVVFLPDPVRISDQLITVGSPVNNGSAVLATSSSDIVVTVDLPASDRDLLNEGDAVTVILPGGGESSGFVQSISSVATRDSNGNVTFEVIVLMEDASTAFTFDQAPVDVEIVTDSAIDVLAVPVTALLVLAKGGYAVEVDLGDGTTGLVAVDPGLFAAGLVEITTDLAVGTRVVVP